MKNCFGQWLGWASLAPCSLWQKQGGLIHPITGSWGAHGHQLKVEDALGYFGAHASRFELKSKTFMLLLEKRRQEETFC